MDKRLILFDFDGTIANTMAQALKISNRLAAEFGYRTLDPEEIEGLRDKSLFELLHFMQVPFTKLPLILAKARNEMRNVITEAETIPGLRAVLEHLHKHGHRMGILTTNSEENVREFLKHNGIGSFDFIQSSSLIWGKHHGLKKILRHERIRPNQMAYVGDETRDIEAAKRANIPMIAVVWGYNSERALRKADPDHLVKQPSELLNLFNGQSSETAED